MSTPPDRTDPVPGPASARRRDRVGLLLLVALTGLPILVLVVALAQRTWYPTGDLAQAELRMRSLPGHPPLLGAAGRIVDDAGRQGNHPGPLMFWVTWPLYALLGRSAWAFETATAVVNLAWLSVAVWLVRWRSGLGVAAWFAGVALVLVGGFGLDALSQPWNPWVALFPFAVLVLATWRALDGWRWAPPLAVAAGSYAIQGHVGYAPIALPLVAAALAAPAVVAWRASRTTTAPATAEPEPDRASAGAADAGRRSIPILPGLAVAVVVGALAWSGPLVDLITNDPSNVSKLLDNFASPSEDPVGLGEGARLLLRSFAPFGAWVTGDLDPGASILPGLALVVAWAAVAATVAWRRASPSLARLDAVLAVTTLFGVFALSRIFGATYLYVFRWATVLVALLVFTLGWGLALLVPLPAPASVRRLAGGGLAVLLVLSVATAVRVAGQDRPYGSSGRMASQLAPEVAGAIDPGQRYLVDWEDPVYLGGIGTGLLLALERDGFDVGALPINRAAVEPHRVRCPGGYDAVLTVVSGSLAIQRWQARPDARMLAEAIRPAGSLPYDRSFEELRRRLAADGTDLTPEQLEATIALVVLSPDRDPATIALAGRLVDDGVPTAVFLQDPAPPLVLDDTPLNEACRPAR